jgi:putative transposase
MIAEGRADYGGTLRLALIARRLRARRPTPHRRWHLDEMFVRIGGRQMYLRRSVEAEGEVMEVMVQA